MTTNKTVFYFAVSLFVVLIDQLSKFFVDTFLPAFSKVVIFKNFVSLEKVYNTGAAFSILQDNNILLIFISLVTVAIITWFVLQKQNQLNRPEILALALISGGAIGNLVDRIWHFFVVDFIQLEFINFPIFNFADIFINVGVIILIVYTFRYKNE